MLSYFKSSARNVEGGAHELSTTEDMSAWEVVERQDESVMGTELMSMTPRSPHDSLISHTGDASPISRKPGEGFPATSISNTNSAEKAVATGHNRVPFETTPLVRSFSAPSGNPFEHFAGGSISDDWVFVDSEKITIHLRGQEVEVWKCSCLECDGTCPQSCPFYRRDIRGRAGRMFKKARETVQDVFDRDDEPDRTKFKAFVTIAGDLADDLGRTLKHKLFD